MASGNGTQHGDWDAQREQLSAYLDGELEAEERMALEAHLVGCAACQLALAELRQTRKLLRALPQPALPRSFTLPVPEAAHASGARAATTPRPARSGQWVARAAQWMGGIAAAAGLVLLLGGALAAGSPPSTGGAASGNFAPGLARQPGGTSSQDGTATHAPQVGVGSGATRTPQSSPSPSTTTPAVTVTQTPPANGTTTPLTRHAYGMNNAPAVPLAEAGAGLTGAGIVLLAGGTVARRRRRHSRRRGDGRATRG